MYANGPLLLWLNALWLISSFILFILKENTKELTIFYTESAGVLKGNFGIRTVSLSFPSIAKGSRSTLYYTTCGFEVICLDVIEVSTET